MEEIEKQMSINDEYVDAFSSVMGPEHPGCLRLYGVGVTKTTLKKKVMKSKKAMKAVIENSVVHVFHLYLNVMGIVAPNRSNSSIATRSVVAVATTVALDLWL
ncbi:hypothetical protein H5410_029416, partial [Solanum commersonii]